MKILLFGCNGQVGWELQRALAPIGHLVALGRDKPDGLCGDLSDLDRVAQTVQTVRPDVIVNAAAYTAVDRAEVEPEIARAVNAHAPDLLAREAKKQGAWLVHYSSDYVFDGSGQVPWNEADATGPLNVYGATKLEGERAVCRSGCRHVILRSSWVYSTRGHNFIRSILRLALKREKLQVIDDQVGAPTGAELIADVTAHVILAACQNPELQGTYHLAATGNTSWYGYARFLLERACSLGWPLTILPGAIEPVSSEAFPTTARRPRNSRLDCDVITETFNLRLPDWREGVERVLSEICFKDAITFGDST